MQNLNLDHTSINQSDEVKGPSSSQLSTSSHNAEDAPPSPSPKKAKLSHTKARQRIIPEVIVPQDHCSSSSTSHPTSSPPTNTSTPSSLQPTPTPPRPKSPSLSTQISDQYWHESEITGHDPSDPNDDGYGINGIGFKPTAAIAWARSQRRKQQVAEWRSREAREARRARSERRRGEGVGEGVGREGGGEGGAGRVRFDDG
jgi:hypothetical protein